MITRSQLWGFFDYIDGVLYNKVARGNAIAGRISGAIGDKGYRITAVSGRPYRNHRLIYLMFHGNLPLRIDHIDGDKLNNRIENLRECTQSQNLCNSKTRKDNMSGNKGVYWKKKKKKWCAEISYRGKRTFLGYFWDKEVAAQILRIERLALHKEFANNG